MRAHIESTYGCTVTQWAEPTDDGDAFTAITHDGTVLLADSLALLVLALTDRAPTAAPRTVHSRPHSRPSLRAA